MNITVLTAVALSLFTLDIEGSDLLSGPSAPPADAAQEPLYDGKTAREWMKVLGSGDAAEREQAAKAVKPAVAGDPAVVAALAKALRDKESKVSLAAQQTLSAAGSAAVPHLIQALWDEKARMPAALALIQVGPACRPAAVPLARLLDSDLPFELRERIASTLIELENHDVVPALVPLLKAGDPFCRLLAARVLAGLEAESAQVIQTYRGLLGESGQDLRLVAASELCLLGPQARPAVPDLVKLLGDKESNVRRSAAAALGAIGPGAADAAAELLRVMKQDADVGARLAAAKAGWQVARSPDVPIELRAMLQVGRPEHKAQAAELLWWTDRSDLAVKALVEVLESSDQDRARAAESLAWIGPAAAPAAKTLGKWLDGNQEDLRGIAAGYLGNFGDAARPFAPRLTEMAKEATDPLQRVQAARSLLLLNCEPGVPDLLKPLLAHESVEVRRATVNQLADRDKAILQPLAPILRSALKDPDGQVRVAAAAALWKIDQSDDARAVLTDALADPDWAVRYVAAMSLGSVLGPAARSSVPALVQALWDENTQVRSSAAEALSRIGPPAKDAVPALVARLRTSGEVSWVYTSAAEALRLIGPAAKEALPELRGLLRHPIGYVRVNAAYALWVLDRDKTAVGELVSGLDHRQGRTRGYAAEALWFVCQDGRSIPTLLRLLEQYCPAGCNEQYIAIRALGRIGPPAKEALPALRRVLTHPDPLLVDAARDAIKGIYVKEPL